MIYYPVQLMKTKATNLTNQTQNGDAFQRERPQGTEEEQVWADGCDDARRRSQQPARAEERKQAVRSSRWTATSDEDARRPAPQGGQMAARQPARGGDPRWPHDAQHGLTAGRRPQQTARGGDSRLGLVKFNRELRIEQKEPRTGTKRTGIEKFGYMYGSCFLRFLFLKNQILNLLG
jgi:hypothetical protein